MAPAKGKVHSLPSFLPRCDATADNDATSPVTDGSQSDDYHVAMEVDGENTSGELASTIYSAVASPASRESQYDERDVEEGDISGQYESDSYSESDSDSDSDSVSTIVLVRVRVEDSLLNDIGPHGDGEEFNESELNEVAESIDDIADSGGESQHHEDDVGREENENCESGNSLSDNESSDDDEDAPFFLPGCEPERMDDHEESDEREVVGEEENPRRVSSNVRLAELLGISLHKCTNKLNSSKSLTQIKPAAVPGEWR